MANRGRPVEADRAEVLRGRVVRLLEMLFGGNQRRASRALGFSQAHLSKVYSGERRVTERLLDTLIEQPGVNRLWLLDGEGEPLLPTSRGTLPVARVLLPSTPRNHPDLLTGERHPVAEVLESDSRYWLPARPYWSEGMGDRLRISPEDLLLVETEHLDRLDLVAGRLSAARVEVKGALTFLLGIVTVESDALSISVFDASIVRETASPDVPALQESVPLTGERRRISRHRRRGAAEGIHGETLTTGDVAKEQAEPPEAGEPPTDRRDRAAIQPDSPGRLRLSGLDSVVGVVLQLERLLLWTGNH